MSNLETHEAEQDAITRDFEAREARRVVFLVIYADRADYRIPRAAAFSSRARAEHFAKIVDGDVSENTIDAGE